MRLWLLVVDSVYIFIGRRGSDPAEVTDDPHWRLTDQIFRALAFFSFRYHVRFRSKSKLNLRKLGLPFHISVSLSKDTRFELSTKDQFLGRYIWSLASSRHRSDGVLDRSSL